METANAYLGQGISFPFILQNGSLPLSGYQDMIEASIKHIVFWEYGTRLFQPMFGSRLWSIIGSPNDAVLQALARRFLIDAINTWEGRITLLESTISMPKAYSLNIKSRYQIDASKQVKDTNFQYNL